MMYHSNVLKQFIKNTKINWTQFRKHNLNDYNVELVITMNLPGIDKLYKSYSRTEGGKKGTLLMSEKDCKTLMHEDSLLRIPINIVKQAYRMSKMSVVNE